MERVIAIDPGDVHVGIALGLGMRCYHVDEITPDGLKERLSRWLEAPEPAADRVVVPKVVVCEEFRLYPWVDQGWSELKTPQLIGAIKLLCEQAGVKGRMQPATIKKPTAAICRAKGIEFRSKASQRHARDAELHLYHYLLRDSQDA